MQKIIVPVPEKFDPDQLLDEREVFNNRARYRDVLYYIVGEITRQTYNNWELFKNGEDLVSGAQLDSRLLKKVLGPRYRDYMDLLILGGCVHKGALGKAGIRATTYHLDFSLFIQPIRWWELTNLNLKRNLRKMFPDRGAPSKSSRKSRTGSPMKTGVQIDLDAALSWINDYQELALSKVAQSSLTLKQRERLIESLRIQVNAFEIQCKTIATNPWMEHNDDFGFRCYTPITNFKSELRCFLRYEGHPLCSLDIRNSQPYFMVALLEGFCRSSLDETGRRDMLQWIKKGPQIIKEKRRREEGSEEGGMKKREDGSIMLHISSETLFHSRFYRSHSCEEAELLEMILQGEVYERLVQDLCGRFKVRGRDLFQDRDSAKRGLLRIFYHDSQLRNRFGSVENSRESYGAIYAFKSRYPRVFQQLESFKQYDYRDLPKLLQRVESYTVLKRIRNRIVRECPGALCLTIHDSVLTTEAYRTHVHEIIKEECTIVTGNKPVLKEELLSSQLAQLELKRISKLPPDDFVQEVKDRIAINKAQGNTKRKKRMMKS